MSPRFCENFTGWLVGEKGKECIIVRTRCKQWSCEYCAEQNKLQWRAIIIDAVNKLGGEWYFLTLTAHENARTRANSLKNLQSGLPRLLDRLRRYCGYSVQYVRVYELHRNGRVHIHALLGFGTNGVSEENAKRIPNQRWFKDNSRQCGMGFQVDFQRISGHAGLVAAYITKYVTKALGKLPANIRRIQTSQKFKQTTEINPSEYTWTIHETFTAKDLTHHFRLGHSVVDVALKRAVTYDDFEQTDYSPLIDK